jgi:hypothetical protein
VGSLFLLFRRGDANSRMVIAWGAIINYNECHQRNSDQG